MVIQSPFVVSKIHQRDHTAAVREFGPTDPADIVAANERSQAAARQIESLLSAWSPEQKDALGFWLSNAATHAGITNKRQRIALQEALQCLLTSALP